MGLIKAGMGAVGGVLADQWKEFFYCDSMPPDVLMMKGQKRTGGRSSNTGGEDNIISNGSVIAVNNGQCMMIVEQGKVVDLCAEPGEYTYDQSSEPSLFTGGLNKESVIAVFKQMGRRLAAIRGKTSVFISSIQRKLSGTSTVRPARFRSRWLMRIPG